jgi:hypothetical protein
MKAMFKLIKINNEKNKQHVITKQRIHVIYSSWDHIRKILVVRIRKESNQTEQWKNRHSSSVSVHQEGQYDCLCKIIFVFILLQYL